MCFILQPSSNSIRSGHYYILQIIGFIMTPFIIPSVILGANYKFRFVGETLMTFLTSKKIIEKNYDLIEKGFSRRKRSLRKASSRTL